MQWAATINTDAFAQTMYAPPARGCCAQRVAHVCPAAARTMWVPCSPMLAVSARRTPRCYKRDGKWRNDAGLPLVILYVPCPSLP